MNKNLFYIVFSFLIFICKGQNYSLKIQVQSDEDRKAMADATINLKNTVESSIKFSTKTHSEGKAIIENIPQGSYALLVTKEGYKTYSQTISIDKNLSTEVYLSPKVINIQEVVITAKESTGLSSTSVIDKRAMQHLQPSSFSDILELLPGGTTKDPIFNASNKIRLRETGIKGDNYNTSSLGTAFLMDGHRINSNANMQYTTGKDFQINLSSGSVAKRRDNTHTGVDMRTISTDQIERVEIIRGIPSVEYGDLTSGLVKIIRKKGHTPYTGRFKADGISKLFAIGKGFELNKNWKLNFDADYLDAISDPQNSFENFKRLTASARSEKVWENTHRRISLNSNIDFSQTIDNEKADPDNDFGSIDSYRSSNKNLSFGNRLEWEFLDSKLIKKIEWEQYLSQDFDRIEQTRFVQLDRPTAVPNTLTEGVSDGVFLKPKYISHLVVDGKPLDIRTKVMADFDFSIRQFLSSTKLGSEWSYSKNNGSGQIFDVFTPPTPDMDTRKRAYKDIPAYQDLSFFIENQSSLPFGKHLAKVALGLRASSLINLPSLYKMQGKYYLDPRISLQWKFAKLPILGKELSTSITAGYGLQTKFPTLLTLYPEKIYKDFTQLNYYHPNPNYRRINIRTHIINPTNYDISPAINKKFELRADFAYAGTSLSITYFDEKMSTGFRNTYLYKKMDFREYDASGIDYHTITAPPAIESLPYKEISSLEKYTTNSNGSETWKRGVEYQLMTKRFPSIKTRFTLNGAFFNTIYRNSLPIYREPQKKIIGSSGQAQTYLGLYESVEGYDMQNFNSNLTIDTYLPNLDMEISLSLQFLWFHIRQDMPLSGTPIAYIAPDGSEHIYTEKDKQDALLQWLNISYNEDAFKRYRTPWSMSSNIKVSKTIYKNYRLAMFVNHLFNYDSPYEQNGIYLSRRAKASPYFGMELNFKF